MAQPPKRRAKRAKAASTRRNRLKGWQLHSISESLTALGEDVTTATLAEVLAAIEQQPSDLPWASVRQSILPLIPRVRAYPPGTPEGVRTMTAMGIVVGFGIDLGPAFITVNAELLRGWSVSMSDLMACALSNVHARAELVDRSMIVHGGGDGIAVDWLQTNRHIGSLLVLAPSELGRIFGSEPRRFITPMRDLIIAFPEECDLDEMRWYHDEVAAQDPNCLGPVSYLFADGRVLAQPMDQRPDRRLARLA